MRGARRRPRWRRCVRSKKASTRVGRSRPAGSSVGSNLPRKLPVPDALLRDQALASIDGKAYHVQGGCILATFMRGESAHRYIAIVAAVETIYDYLDNLCDRLPGVSQQAFATLHAALIDALDDRRDPIDYYRDGPAGDDAGEPVAEVVEI